MECNMEGGGVDVVIVGGGTMGLFLALFLARAGRQVVVIEQGRVWGEASGVNAGSLAVQNKMLALIPYTLEAVRMWAGLHRLLGASVGYRRTGGYKIATTPQEVERLRRGADEQAGLGVPLRWLGATELARETPWLSPRVLAAAHCEADGYASPIQLGPALRRAVLEAGVGLAEHEPVLAIGRQGSGYAVETAGRSFRAASLVLAAGAWSSPLARMLGVDLPVSLDVNMVSVTEPAPCSVVGRIVTHTRGILTLKQVANGTCLIGGGWQGLGTLDDGRKAVDFDQLTHNMRLAVQVIPGLAPLHVVRSWAGYEGVSPDSLPYVGRLPGQANAYVVACARGGFTLGPLLARLLSELMLTGETSLPVAAFDPARFCHG